MFTFLSVKLFFCLDSGRIIIFLCLTSGQILLHQNLGLHTTFIEVLVKFPSLTILNMSTDMVMWRTSPLCSPVHV